MTIRVYCCVLACMLLVQTVHADLASSISRVKPSVVILGTYTSTNSPRFSLSGTGFVVGHGTQVMSNLVITNAHVLAQPRHDDSVPNWVVQIQVAPHGWQMRTATVLEIDRQHDLALLRFQGPKAPALVIRDSARLQEGQAVAFTGFPIGGALGFSPVTHRGTISSITAAALPTPTAKQLNEKAIRNLRSGSFEIFQLDATAYPGNSGGPLFDPEKGDVLGVVNMVFIKGSRESALTNPSGISYAIPSAHVLQLLGRVPLTPD